MEGLKFGDLVTVNGEGNEIFKIVDVDTSDYFLLNELGKSHGWESKKKCHLHDGKLILDGDITIYKINKYDNIEIDIGYLSRSIDKNETMKLIEFLQKQLEK